MGKVDNRMLMEYMKSEFGHVKENITEVKEHLKTLNGQVAKNTKFRNFSWGGIKISAYLIGIFSGLVIFYFQIIK